MIDEQLLAELRLALATLEERGERASSAASIQLAALALLLRRVIACTLPPTVGVGSFLSTPRHDPLREMNSSAAGESSAVSPNPQTRR